MHDNGTDVVRMRFEGSDLFAGIVVVDAQLKVVAAAYYPVLAGYESASANGDIGKLEGFDDRLGFVRPDIDMAAIKGGKDLEGSVLRYSIALY